MYNLLYHRFLKFACKALNHDSVLVQSVLKCSVESCSNFIGYNFLYGTPEFIMTMKDSVVKLFVKSVPLTFMALSNLNSIQLLTVFVNSNSLYVYLSHAPMWCVS